MAIDINHCYSTPPKPRAYVLPALIPGTVGSIVAPGGAGKSMFAVELAHYVASGADLLGLGGQQHTGRVAYLSAEDGVDMLHERLHAIGQNLTCVQRETCAEQLTIEDLTKHSPNLFEQRWLDAVERLATGTRLLFLDTLRSFHGGDENDGSQMSVLIGSLRALAARTGCAIVFLHHTNKAATLAGQGDIQQAGRGSSVLTDNIRWQSFLAGMTPAEARTYNVDTDQRGYFVRFGLSKQNYGRLYDDRWFRRREDDGVLVPTDFATNSITRKGTAKKTVNDNDDF